MNKHFDIKYHCKECKEKVGWKSALYGSGLCKSCAYKKKAKIFRGKKASNYKDGRTNKKYYCSDCHKIISFRANRCRSCSAKERASFRDINGANNPMWNGGSSFEPYAPEFNASLKESIRDRDHRECQICHKKEKDLKGLHKKLCVHHIDYDKANYNEENLISLCLDCHNKTNNINNRDYWFAYFTELTKILLKCDDLT